MATYKDLQEGCGHDEALAWIDKLMPGWRRSDDPSLEALALLLLDAHYGLSLPGDYVLVSPDCVWGLWTLKIANRRIARAVQAMDGNPGREEDEAICAVVTKKPFKVLVDDEPTMLPDWMFESDRQLPEPLRGRVIRVLVIPDDAIADFAVMSTRRASGAAIDLPGSDFWSLAEY